MLGLRTTHHAAASSSSQTHTHLLHNHITSFKTPCNFTVKASYTISPFSASPPGIQFVEILQLYERINKHPSHAHGLFCIIYICQLICFQCHHYRETYTQRHFPITEHAWLKVKEMQLCMTSFLQLSQFSYTKCTQRTHIGMQGTSIIPATSITTNEHSQSARLPC